MNDSFATINSTTIKELKPRVQNILKTDPRVAQWGLLRVYHNQTAHEQQHGLPIELNGLGFTKVDSRILTSLSQHYESRRFLSPKQMAIVHQLVPKYWRRIIKGLSNEELDGVLSSHQEQVISKLN